MTRIDAHGPGTASPQTDAAGRRDGRLDAALSRARTGGRETHADLGTEAGLGDAARREAAFGERMRHALGGDGAPDEKEREAAGEARLLAVAERAASPFAAMAAPVAVSPEAAPKVGALIERVEAALATLPREGSGAGATLRIDLSGIPGLNLAGLTVAIAPDGLDVVLTVPPTATLDAGLREAAGALAERLQGRFRSRVVRVFEAAGAPAASEAEDALGEIGALLAGRRA
ncbi:hypothetical protein [Aureimonas leprariae]|uniref:Uncharacterized protein n=1 Tax=Plantimonas leprariae TaxID=2615207 RepID=A0A7V7TY89_9HYPH|nr:hypothetical protein [Aureimonas leprariae]KAB0676847.1 hypothetical protein F6X38_19950 [Aureimonas leprariae]